jgi:hypothetical protein
MVFQDRGGGLGFLGRQDATGHGVGDGGQRLYQICSTDDRRQSQPNAPAAAGWGEAIEHQPGLAAKEIPATESSTYRVVAAPAAGSAILGVHFPSSFSLSDLCVRREVYAFPGGEKGLILTYSPERDQTSELAHGFMCLPVAAS